MNEYLFQIIFLLYLVWMAIIFMNLLVGLTVDSIEILKEKSTIIMDVKRIEDIKLGLKFLPTILRPAKITTMLGKRKTKKVNVLIEVELKG